MDQFCLLNDSVLILGEENRYMNIEVERSGGRGV